MNRKAIIILIGLLILTSLACSFSTDLSPFFGTTKNIAAHQSGSN